MTTLARFIRDETGATSVEYGLIAVGISAAIVAVLQGIGAKLRESFLAVEPALY
jgi:pilus assembly protein Flp/PilA